MVIRSIAKQLTLGIMILGLVACTSVEETTLGGGTPAEKQLSEQSFALQKTIVEGALAGGVAGGLSVRLLPTGKAGNNVAGGVLIGTGLGAAAGTYVAFLQKRFRTKEARLEKLQEDARRNNAQVAAAIQTMRLVLAQQQADLNFLRTTSRPKDKALRAELEQAQGNLRNMERAIDGAEKRRAELSSTRDLQLVEGEVTGIDQEIAELAARIQNMREIANTLAEEI